METRLIKHRRPFVHGKRLHILILPTRSGGFVNRFLTTITWFLDVKKKKKRYYTTTIDAEGKKKKNIFSKSLMLFE